MPQFERDGRRVRISGAMTVESVNALLDESIIVFAADNAMADLSGGSLEMDMSAVSEVDSSAIALIFEWLRRAYNQKAILVFTNLPANLTSLAALYGVLELIPQQSH